MEQPAPSYGTSYMKLYGLDIETYDPYLTDKGASWVYGEGGIIVTGLYNRQTGKKSALSGNGGLAVKKLLLDPEVTLAGANIVYDIGWLCYEHKLSAKEVKCSLVDVSVAEQCIDEYQPFSLDALAWKYLCEKKGVGKLPAVAAAKGLKGDFRKHLKTLWDTGYENEIKEYVVSDADQPVRIWEKQTAVLTVKPEKGCEDFTGSMEAVMTNFKLIKIVLDMKQRGVRIDMKKRTANAKLLQAKADEIFPAFEQKYGKINLNSPKQVAELFRRERVPFRYKLRIKGRAPEGRKFKNSRDCFAGDEIWEQRKKLRDVFNGLRIEKGTLVLYQPVQYAARTRDDLCRMGYEVTCNPSVGKKALEKHRRAYRIVQDVIDLKSLRYQLDNFFGKNFERYIVNGRIHPDFNIVGARQTGRFSSSAPNGQNIPSRTILFEGTPQEIKVYKLCRECFLPDGGMLMGKCDFSGQENRLMAHFAVGSQGGYIRKKYNDDPDFDEHDLVGKDSGLYEEHGREVGRKYIKNYRFGKAYGMQINTMMEYFGWTKEHAGHMDQVFADCAPWVGETMDRVQKIILKRGYIKTVAGRHGHLQSFKGVINKRSAYKGFNKLIQGSGSDLMKKALVNMWERGLCEVFPLYLTIHDEIDFGIPKNAGIIRRLPEVQECMEHTYALSVPMRVDPETGRDWGHMAGRKKEKRNEKTGKVIRKAETLNRFIERIIKEAGK
jgi:DNA polymerase I-like protein with 3'-5' exonuclease and polymerase domains